MPSDRDYEFARIAVELGRLTQAQADALLADLSAAELLGVADSLDDLAQKRGLVSEADRAALNDRVALALGRRVEVGGFEILERIGRGGMGTVYRARQLSMDRIVALKILSRRLARSPEYVDRFFREARAAARLNHPNIVQGIDAGQSGGYYYFAMEYVKGETVSELVKRMGPLGEKEAARIGAQVARALEHAHARANIIHRDVKPQNILLDPSGTAKLADLGLAREAVGPDAAVTYTGVTLGTPDYISPEQIRGESDLDGRCDIYSLGATLYHMLIGKPPFRGETANVTMARHLTDPVPDPAAECPGLSPAIAAIVRTAMQKEKAKRYQTVEEMARALEAVVRGEAGPTAAPGEVARALPGPGRKTRVAKSQPKSGAVPVALGLGALCVVIALAVIIALRSKAPPPGEQVPPPEPVSGPVERSGPPEAVAPRERTGAETYARAQALVRENRAEPWLALGELRKLRDECKGTDYEGAADLLLEQVRREHQKRAETTLGELEDQANELCAKNEFGKALAVLDGFPKALLLDDWELRVSGARKAVEAKAAEAFERERAAAESAATKGEYDRAMGLMKAVGGWGIRALASQADEEAAGLAKRKAEADRRAGEESFGALVAHMVKIVPALERREYARAGALADAAARDQAVGGRAEWFVSLGRDIGELAGLLKEAEARLAAMRPGDNVRVGGMLRKFVRFENGAVTASVPGVPPKTVALSEMGEVDLFELLAPYFNAGRDDPRTAMRRGLFYTFDGQRKLDRARKEFAAAEKLGDARGAARGLAYVAMLAQLEPEQAAMVLLGEARAAAAAKDWAKLGDAVKKLEGRNGTQIVRKSEKEIAALGFLAAGRGRGLPDLFSGQAAFDGADSITVGYGLRREADARDWRGGTRGPAGLRFDRELRWNAGLRPTSIKLVLNWPDRVERTEVRLLCSPQGDRPLATAVLGVLGGRWSSFEGQPGAIKVLIAAKTDATVELSLGATAKLTLGGKDSIEAPVVEYEGIERTMYLTSGGVPVDLVRAVVTGRVDPDWARRRLALLADLAESKLLRTIDVPADKATIETGLVLDPANRYHFKATGWWQFGRLGGQVSSAAGKPQTLLALPLYSLIAKVGGGTYYVGEEGLVGPYVSGRLDFGMHEMPQWFGDNSGSVTVEVRELPRRVPTLVPGLRGAFYATPSFDGLKFVKTAAKIDFDAAGLAAAAGQPERFSVRWEGYVKISEPGDYEFEVLVDDGFRLWVDGRKVLDQWRLDDRNTGTTRAARLEKGYCPIVFEYLQNAGDARARLFWRSPGRKSEIIPPEALFHAEE